MPNFIQLNSDKPAPPKVRERCREDEKHGDGRTARGFGLGIFGYRCAVCGYYHNTTGGSKFKKIRGQRRRVGPGCAAGGVCGFPAKGGVE